MVAQQAALTARPLGKADFDAARELARGVGAHGVYVGNFLADTRESSSLALLRGEDLVGLAYFGGRGNLVVIEREPLEGVTVARHLLDSQMHWRIVVGPPAVVDALAAREPRRPLVHRRQAYYAMLPGDAPGEVLRDDARLAERRDQAVLLSAALELNRVDLNIDPRKVHKPWLRDSIRRRIKARQTLVVGLVGAPQCKLDIGSDGSFGVVVEGVYTIAEARGRGLATGLVATAAHRAAAAPLVCLHVAEDNLPARRAYERAGMQFDRSCMLMLRG